MDNRPIPRIASLEVVGPSTLHLRWCGSDSLIIVDLAAWIASGDDMLAPLRDPAFFAQAKVGEYGAAIFWDDVENEGDLAIDSAHLEMLAEEQALMATAGRGSMDHSDFQIGLEFWSGNRQYRCTDVGSRVIVAIRVDAAAITSVRDGATATQTLTRAEAEQAGCFFGPPYKVVEHVFDEYDLDGCSLEPDPD